MSLEHHGLVTFVIFQHGIRLSRQCLAITSVWIDIDRDHVRPLLEVFLAFGREFMLMIHRPAVQITDAVENECGFRRSSSGARLLRVEQADPIASKTKTRKALILHMFKSDHLHPDRHQDFCGEQLEA